MTATVTGIHFDQTVYWY